jgi:hypothetical protein
MPRVRAWLVDFRDNVRTDWADVSFDRNFSLRVDLCSSGPQAFVFGGLSDHDSGGEVPTMMIESIRRVIDKKTEKIADVLINHRIWWLLLVDWVGHGPSLGTQQRVKQAVKVPPPWSRVILVNVLNDADAFELDLP